MENFLDRGIWIRDSDPVFFLDQDTNPILKKSWFWIRCVLIGRFRIRPISDWIRNPVCNHQIMITTNKEDFFCEQFESIFQCL